MFANGTPKSIFLRYVQAIIFPLPLPARRQQKSSSLVANFRDHSPIGMYPFTIHPLSPTSRASIQHKIDHKTKPVGSLGRLEELALQICLIQQTAEPALTLPTMVIFAGDHGITHEKVSLYPREVTYQMVFNFLQEGAAINVLSRQNGLQVKVVDAGVDFDFPNHPLLLRRKIRRGTTNFLQNTAMSRVELEAAIQAGAEVVQTLAKEGCNTIGFGEMGIGNTSAAALIMHKLTTYSLEECVGKGTGLADEAQQHKLHILSQAVYFHKNLANNPLMVLQTFGGFEIAMLCGAFLQAAASRMVVLVDGFIATSALLVAAALHPAVLEYCIFCHVSDEKGHRKMLDFLQARPLLQLGMRLGEGTGVALAFPLIKAAVSFINEMASFESAGVSTENT